MTDATDEVPMRSSSFEPENTPSGVRLENYSKLYTLIRAIASVQPTFQKYVNILRKRLEKPLLFQKPQKWNYETILTLLLHADQKKHYSVIFHQLQNDASQSQTVLLGRAYIVKASSGLLCKRSFLPSDTLSKAGKFPILLNPTSYLTRLIVLDIHSSIAHQQVQMTLASIRNKYY